MSNFFLFKVDFEKAFDSINWSFLDLIMEQTGFRITWRLWIRGCLQSARASVIVKGSPICEFPLSKGVRQGDPCSYFLFIIVMDILNIAMRTASTKSIFSDIKLPNNGPLISHLLYADNVIFVGEGTHVNIKNIAKILRCFQVSLGLKVNFHKSKVIGLCVENCETRRWAIELRYLVESLLFMDLGVSVGANMSRKKYWQPVIERFQSKLSYWKDRHLSFGGSVKLIKWFLVVCRPVISHYSKHLHADDIFQQHVFSGNKTLLWKDKWFSHNTLQELFPNLYALESQKSCFISERREGGEHDKFWCKVYPDGKFTVEALRRCVDSKITNTGGEPFIWLKIVSIKLSNFAWRAKIWDTKPWTR
uniref:Reverse transcriptase domain-containing protein n=1 Tax=Lactuca sativa TaxID=4236 RepID=A0A9R1W6K2_LACSA|nr:hypothetical protein LSAT_V11C300123850 [Lactuca sativa]